jgi:hypothetical protein
MYVVVVTLRVDPVAALMIVPPLNMRPVVMVEDGLGLPAGVISDPRPLTLNVVSVAEDCLL